MHYIESYLKGQGHVSRSSFEIMAKSKEYTEN